MAVVGPSCTERRGANPAARSRACASSSAATTAGTDPRTSAGSRPASTRPSSTPPVIPTTTWGSSWRASAATLNASNGVAAADEYSAPSLPAARSNGTAWAACDSIATTSTSPPGARPKAARRGASDSASSSMSACATGHGVTSPSTTMRLTPHTSGGSSYRFANITISLLRHPGDLVRWALAQQDLVGDELDLGLDADRLVH